jgi:hypothetical protein
MTKKKTHEQYEKQLMDLEIDYWPMEQYNGALNPIIHECLSGHQWPAAPSKILSHKGCPYCSGVKKKTTETYIEELLSKNIHYTVIDEYISALTPILHECQEGHQWNVTPNKILAGRGCPSCAKYGFNKQKPAILYYIKITSYHEEVYYKIGITNRDVADRFFRDKDKTIQILLQKEFATGINARLEEQSILSKYKDKRVSVPSFLKSGGNTELFEIDILGLDP